MKKASYVGPVESSQGAFVVRTVCGEGSLPGRTLRKTSEALRFRKCNSIADAMLGFLRATPSTTGNC